MTKRVRFILGSLAVVAFLALPSIGLAQTCGFTSQLNTPNDQLAPFLPAGGTFGTVCVNLVDSNTATIVFTTINGFLFGAAGALDLNINTAGAFSVSASATQFPTHAAPSLSIDAPPGAPQVDGQGNFNLVIDNFDGFNNAFQTATVTVDLTTGTFANAASVLAFNADGRDAAAHIFVCDDPLCTTGAGSPQTGFAGETTGAGSVPEPTSIVLLGGIVAIVASRLRKRVVAK